MEPFVLVRFVLGLLMLLVGAEALVRGASRLAAAAGVSALVIGLTVVAFGTSAPELAVSVGAVLSGGGGADVEGADDHAAAFEGVDDGLIDGLLFADRWRALAVHEQ